MAQWYPFLSAAIHWRIGLKDFLIAHILRTRVPLEEDFEHSNGKRSVMAIQVVYLPPHAEYLTKYLFYLKKPIRYLP
ncbi:hypothetical protein WKH31_19040 [Metabacillus indicus]|uniref:hypothetical protein n=1 Tax=Metabacillus indicus TaxID=246786 RepID=UPI0031778C96